MAAVGPLVSVMYSNDSWDVTQSASDSPQWPLGRCFHLVFALKEWHLTRSVNSAGVKQDNWLIDDYAV